LAAVDQVRKIVHCPRVTLHNRQAVVVDRAIDVGFNAGAELEFVAERVRALSIVLLRRKLIESERLRLVGFDAVTPSKHIAEIDLRVGVAACRALGEEAERKRQVAAIISVHAGNDRRRRVVSETFAHREES
jgi:hypothetical protein